MTSQSNSLILSSIRKNQRINIKLSKHLLSAKNRNINSFNSFNSFANNFGAINSVNSEQTGKNIPNVNPYGIQNTIEEENINRTDTQGVKSNIFGINFQRNDDSSSDIEMNMNMNIGHPKSKKMDLSKMCNKCGCCFFKIKTHLIQCNPGALERRELIKEYLKEYQKLKELINHLSFLKKIIETKNELVAPSLVENYLQVSNALSGLQEKII